MPERAIAALLAVAGLACAQSLHFGIRVGVPLNGVMEAGAPGFHADTGRFTFGPALELLLPHRFGVRADLLYQHVKYGSAIGDGSANRWELPLMVKYSPVLRVPGLFAAAGVSLDRVGGVHGVRVAELRHRGTVGFCAGSGMDIRLGAMRFVPEIRVTHWTDRNFGVRDAALRSRLTQAEFLAGFVF